jgi:hypothetical protein
MMGRQFKGDAMRIVLLALMTGAVSACVNLPDVYVIDHHTAMESEASGEWPQLEQRLREQAVSKGPVNLPKDPFERRRERAFNVLNGEFPAQGSDVAASAP